MIVFLDFDGVAHPDRSRTEPKFCRLPLIESWLRARPAVDVVISSSWREVHPFRELVEFFSDDIQPRVIGCTPVFHRVSPAELEGGKTGWPLRHKREAEVRQWMLDSWDPARPWVALDDMPELFQLGCKALVLCDPTVGITDATLDELDSRLRANGYEGATR